MEQAKVRDALVRQHLSVILAAGGIDDLARLLIGRKRPRQRRDRELRLQICEHARCVSTQIRAAHGDVLNTLGAVATRQSIV